MNQAEPDFKHQALNLSAQYADAGEDWLAGVRERGRNGFADLPMPSRKTEAWRYSPVSAALSPELARRAPSVPVVVAEVEGAVGIPLAEVTRLVFVNGHFNRSLSSDQVPQGMRLVRFAEADPGARELIRDHLGRIAATEKHVFGALNASLLHDGVLVQVEAGADIAKPIHLVWYTAAVDAPGCTTPRLLWLQGSGSRACVIEHFVGAEGARDHLGAAVSEFTLEDNAELTHYRLQLEHGELIHVGGVHVELHRDSRLHSHQLGLGGKLKRADTEVWMRGEGAECTINGIYLTRDRQHIDNHLDVEHSVGHCRSESLFKGIVDDRSKAVFNGRIHIHEQAQRTDAHLTNRNLLLSNQAEVDTKPELEIYADDVQCSHGATVGQLDPQALFYLRARGIDAERARSILSVGFVNELLHAMPHAAVRQSLEPHFAAYFGDRETVDRILDL